MIFLNILYYNIIQPTRPRSNNTISPRRCYSIVPETPRERFLTPNYNHLLAVFIIRLVVHSLKQKHYCSTRIDDLNPAMIFYATPKISVYARRSICSRFRFRAAVSWSGRRKFMVFFFLFTSSDRT